jgi:signal transduction histidine kinase
MRDANETISSVILALAVILSCVFVGWTLFLIGESRTYQRNVRARVSCISLLFKYEYTLKTQWTLAASSSPLTNNEQWKRAVLREKALYAQLEQRVASLHGTNEQMKPFRQAWERLVNAREDGTPYLGGGLSIRIRASQKSVVLLRRQLSVLSRHLAKIWEQLSFVAVLSCVGAVLFSLLLFILSRKHNQWRSAYESLQRSEAHNSALLHALSDTTMVFHRETMMCLELNLGEDNPFEIDEATRSPQPLSSLLPPPVWDVLAPEMEALGECAPDAHSHRRVEYTSITEEGGFLTLEARLAMIDEGRCLLIVRDITEQKQNEYLKDEFIANVSHELRTPLTSIRGSLSLLNHQFHDDMTERIRPLVSIAEKNSIQLHRLIDDLLDVQKMSYGQLAFSFVQVELNELLKQAIETNEPFASKHGVSLRFVSETSQLWCETDAKRFLQIVANLLSNAVKFSGSSQVVDVRLVSLDGRCRVEVEDYGIGISGRFQRKLFQKFSQAKDSSNKTSGTGLGLAICKSWIEKLGGELQVRSEVGQGSLFSFTLPCVSGTVSASKSAGVACGERIDDTN